MYKAMVALLNAIAALIASVTIPLVILVIAIMYRSQITNILPRLKKGRILGQEIELESGLQAVSQLEALVDARFADSDLKARAAGNAERRVNEQAPASPRVANESGSGNIDGVIASFGKSADLGLIQVRVEIGKALTRLLKAAGDPTHILEPTIDQSLKHLKQLGGSYDSVASAIEEYLRDLDVIIEVSPENRSQLRLYYSTQVALLNAGIRYIQVVNALSNTLAIVGPKWRDELMYQGKTAQSNDPSKPTIEE